MKVYTISNSGEIWKNAIFKTKKLATDYLLRIEPTCKKQTKRNKICGYEVYDNEKGKTYCIITLNVIEASK